MALVSISVLFPTNMHLWMHGRGMEGRDGLREANHDSVVATRMGLVAWRQYDLGN